MEIIARYFLYLFNCKFGNIDDAYKLTKKKSNAVRDGGLERNKLSSIRHTYVTLMLKNNIVSVKMNLLGYWDIQKRVPSLNIMQVCYIVKHWFWL